MPGTVVPGAGPNPEAPPRSEACLGQAAVGSECLLGSRQAGQGGRGAVTFVLSGLGCRRGRGCLDGLHQFESLGVAAFPTCPRGSLVPIAFVQIPRSRLLQQHPGQLWLQKTRSDAHPGATDSNVFFETWRGAFAILILEAGVRRLSCKAPCGATSARASASRQAARTCAMSRRGCRPWVTSSRMCLAGDRRYTKGLYSPVPESPKQGFGGGVGIHIAAERRGDKTNTSSPQAERHRFWGPFC